MNTQSIKSVAAELRAVGVICKRTEFGEFEVYAKSDSRNPLRHYFASDLSDALATGKRIAQRSAQSDVTRERIVNTELVIERDNLARTVATLRESFDAANKLAEAYRLRLVDLEVFVKQAAERGVLDADEVSALLK